MADEQDGTRYNAKAPRPGVGGAIHDAIAAITNFIGPKAVTQRRPKLAQQEQEAGSQSLGDQLNQ